MRESVIERYLKKKSEEQGFICNKFVSPGNAGVPDRVLVGHGITLFVELKAPGQHLRPLQVHVVDKFKEHGALVYVADTKERVDEILHELVPMYKF